MSVSREYLSWLCEIFAPLGEVKTRRMFGGAGVSIGEHMIAIVADDTLWLKADDTNRAEFEQLSLQRFIFQRLDKDVAMNFYQLPEDALESQHDMLRWAKSALGAALRSGKAARSQRKSSQRNQR